MATMLFSRRVLQERLASLESALRPISHADLVGRLNRPGRNQLSATWEVVWLDALSKLVRIRHEEPLPSGSKPDFQLSLSTSEGDFVVVGDITTASDKGLDGDNPIDQFWEEVVRLAKKYSLNPNHFRYKVGNRTVGEFGDSKVLLTLPPRSQLRELLKAVVEPFVRKLAKDPVAVATFSHTTEDVEFSLSYDQSQQFAGGSYASYAIPYSSTRNPLVTALEKKAGQLKSAPDDAARLVILCDGDCHAMKQSMLMSGGAFSAEQVVDEFLCDSSSIDAVLLVAVESRSSIFATGTKLELSARLVVPYEKFRNARLSSNRLDAIKCLLDQALKLLPQPTLDARNAVLRCDQKNFGSGTNGYQMSNSHVAVSSRAMLELLAGKTTLDDFLGNYGWNSLNNPFLRMLERGLLIDQAAIKDGGDADDDWIDLHFAPDAAVRPFARSDK
jgi:hypothetical protein